MVLRYYGWQTDPQMLNELLKKNNGFDANGSLYWGKMVELYGGKQKIIDARSREMNDTELSELFSAIKSNKPVIVQVDMLPATAVADMHFVVGYDIDSNDIVIADPWTGKTTTLLKTYGNNGAWSIKRAAYRFIIFEPDQKTDLVTPPVTGENTGNEDCKKKCKKLQDELDIANKKLSDIKKIL